MCECAHTHVCAHVCGCVMLAHTHVHACARASVHAHAHVCDCVCVCVCVTTQMRVCDLVGAAMVATVAACGRAAVCVCALERDR